MVRSEFGQQVESDWAWEQVGLRDRVHKLGHHLDIDEGGITRQRTVL